MKGETVPFEAIFSHGIKTETRITDSNDKNNFNNRNSAPENPLQYLYVRSRNEKNIAECFQKAFNKGLFIDKGAGNKIPLRVGIKPLLATNEEETDNSYNEKLKLQALSLEKQGDGMRSFTSILLLDETEAFLYPPQAKI